MGLESWRKSSKERPGDGHWRWQDFAREVGIFSNWDVNHERGPDV